MYNKGMKNTHLEHLEDEILNRGSAGAEDVISVLQSADDILTGKSNDLGITTKWDGAPAVVCGTCPQTGKFFVGTKSVFNKTTPKICYTESDIDQWYQGALASKLKTCLQYLSQLRIIGIVQGDLLFTDDVIPGVIGKNKVLTFTPNTITYTVPVGSEAANQIMVAKMGIVFHTTYIGPSIQTAEVVIGTPDIRGSEDVFVASAKFDGYVKVSDAQIRHYRALVNRAVGSIKQASNFLDIFNSGESRFVMAAMFKQFFNQVVRKGYIVRSTKYVASEFANFYASKMESEIQSKKSDAAKAKYLRMKTDGLKFIIANERAIYFTVASYLNIRSAKKFVIDQLNSGGTIGTYTRSNKGYQRTTPEGFVLVKSGGAYKFVDDNFRRANVTVVKNWDK